MNDLVFLNARIVLPDQSRFHGALRVADGRIAEIGEPAGVLKRCADSTVQMDLAGACVMPGFIDSHLHLRMGAEYLANIGLRDARSLSDVLSRIEGFAHANPELEWLLGHEWSYGYPDMPADGFESAMIDAIVPDRPVFLRSGMAHAAWANSVALARAGITAETPDPPGGEIMRRPDGTPSGWLKEQAAKLVERCVPPMEENRLAQGLHLALAEMARCGITRVQSAAYDEGLLPLLAAMEARGTLTCRVGMMVEMPPPTLSKPRLAMIHALRSQYDTPFLRIDGIKFFLDGVLESHTAWMEQGYADRPDETGSLIWDRRAYTDAVGRSLRDGFQVWTHAIGSSAIRLALDAYAAEPEATARLRPRVEHVEIPFAEDISRFRQLGVVACFQPVMVAPSDEWMGMAGVWAQRVTPAELGRGFAIRTFLDAGAAVAFGTDWPIVSLSPLRGIRKAVMRQSLEGGPAFVPEQAITVREGVTAYTSAGAYACLREEGEGAIAEGRVADLTILAADPEAVAPDELRLVPVLMTVVGGRIVYDGRAERAEI